MRRTIAVLAFVLLPAVTFGQSVDPADVQQCRLNAQNDAKYKACMETKGYTFQCSQVVMSGRNVNRCVPVRGGEAPSTVQQASEANAAGQSGGGGLQLTPANPRDPADLKAILATRKALTAARIDLKSVRFGMVDQFNAFYAGNGVIAAGKPLAQAMPQWAVDAIMAHEVGHMVHRHVETTQAVATGTVLGLELLGLLVDPQHSQQGMQAGAQVGKVALQLFVPKFTQSQELEADAYGAKLLRAEGYPPGVGARTFALMEQMVGPSGGGFFDTHPSFEERIRRLRGK